VANPDLKLKPGMTANVTVAVAESDNVLSVPNAALRFRPDTAPPPRRNSSGPVLWKIENGAPTPVNVKTGVTDGVRTEIVSWDLKEGDVVAVASTSANGTKAAAAPAARSPFAAGGRGGR